MHSQSTKDPRGERTVEDVRKNVDAERGKINFVGFLGSFLEEGG